MKEMKKMWRGYNVSDTPTPKLAPQVVLELCSLYHTHLVWAGDGGGGNGEDDEINQDDMIFLTILPHCSALKKHIREEHLISKLIIQPSVEILN